jgi:hypothetical protein
MWLPVPQDGQDDSEGTFLEGPLEPEAIPPGTPQRGDSPGSQPPGPDVARSLPVISIGQPRSWPLADLFDTGQVPATIRESLADADFYLVRLACSFRPAHGEGRIEWARFLVEMHPDTAGRQPVTESQHPLEVTQPVQHQLKFTLSPTFTFQPVQVSAGDASAGVEYQELRPRITAAGIGTPQASWDYFEVPGIEVTGGKWMHLVARTPKGTSQVSADLSVTADIRVGRRVVRAVMGTRHMHDHRQALLWE